MPTFEELLKTNPNEAFKQGATFSGEALKTFVGTPTPPTPPTGPTLPPGYASRINAVPEVGTPPAPVDEAAIRRAAQERAQSIVNSMNAQFAPLLEAQNQENTRNEARTRATNISSGLAGSDFATGNAQQTEKAGSKAIALLNEQKAAKIAEVLTAADDRASTEIQNARTNLRLDTTSYLENRKAVAEQAKTDISALAGAGVDLAKLKVNEPDTYVKLLNQAGFGSELAFDSYFNTSKPKASQVDWNEVFTQDASGNAVLHRYGVNPVTNQLESHDYPTGLPYSSVSKQETQVIDGVLYGKASDGSWKPLTPESDKSKLAVEHVRLQNAKLKQDIASGGKSYMNAPLDAITKLQDPTTGYVSPNAYRDLYTQFIKDNPGKGKEFTDSFQPSIYLSPADALSFK